MTCGMRLSLNETLTRDKKGDRQLSESSQSPFVLRKIQHEQFDFGHFFDGVAEAFASEAGVLHPAVRHVVGAEGGNLVDQNRADLQITERLKGLLEILREHARLQPIG